MSSILLEERCNVGPKSSSKVCFKTPPNFLIAIEAVSGGMCPLPLSQPANHLPLILQRPNIFWRTFPTMS